MTYCEWCSDTIERPQMAVNGVCHLCIAYDEADAMHEAQMKIHCDGCQKEIDWWEMGYGEDFKAVLLCGSCRKTWQPPKRCLRCDAPADRWTIEDLAGVLSYWCRDCFMKETQA